MPTKWRRNPDQHSRSKPVLLAVFHSKHPFHPESDIAQELVSHAGLLSKPNKFFTHVRDAFKTLSFKELTASHVGK
jgi:hypothetical protein